MSYFEEAKQKAREVAAVAAEKARAAADSAKISAAIIAEKRELDKNYRAIGQWYACEYAQSAAGVSCPVCGKISDTKYCPHCGAPMGE